MPGSSGIGKASIKVVPDTRNFKKDAENDIKRALASLKTDPVEITLEIDTSKVKAEIAKLSDEKVTINAELKLDTSEFKAQLERIKQKDLQLSASLGVVRGIAEARREAQNRLNATTPLSVPAKLQLVPLSDFREGLKEIKFSPVKVPATFEVDLVKSRAEMQRRADTIVPIRIPSILDIDREATQKDFDREFNSIVDNLKADGFKLDLDVDDTKFKNKLKDARGTIRGLGDESDKQGKRSGNVFTRVFGQIKDGFSSTVSSAVSGLGSVASSVSGVASSLATLVVIGAALNLVLGAVGAAVGAAVAALTTLPVILASLGAAAGVAVLGMDGLKKAAGSMTPSLNKLKTVVSGIFEKDLTPHFKELGRTLESLTPEIKVVAKEFTGLVGEILGGLNTPGGKTFLREALDGAKQALNAFKTAVPDVRDALGNLFQIGAEEGEGFRQTLLRLTGGFKSFTEEIKKSGEGNKGIENLLSLVEKLASALGRISKVSLKEFNLSSPAIEKFIASFTNFLVGVLPTAGEHFRNFLELFAKYEPQITGFVKAFLDLTGFLAEIALISFGEGLLAIEFMVKAVGALVRAFQDLKAEDVVNKFNEMDAKFMALGDTVDRVVDRVADFGIRMALAAGSGIATFVASVVTGIEDFKSRTNAQFDQMISNAIAWVGNFTMTIVNGFINMVNQVLLQIGIWHVGIVTRIQALGSQFLAFWTGLWNQAVSFVTERLSAIVGAVQLGFSSMVNTTTTGGTNIQNAVINTWNNVVNTITNFMARVVSSVQLGWNQAVAFTQALPGRIMSIINSLGPRLLAAGAAIMGDFARGITNGIGRAVSAATNAVSAISRLFPRSPAKEGPFSGRGYTTFSGAAVMQDFGNGMKGQTTAVLNVVNGLMSQVQSGFTTLSIGASIEDATPDAIRQAEALGTNLTTTATADVDQAVQAEGFGGLRAEVSAAMSGWSVVIDKNGIAKLVNTRNAELGRRAGSRG